MKIEEIELGVANVVEIATSEEKHKEARFTVNHNYLIVRTFIYSIATVF